MLRHLAALGCSAALIACGASESGHGHTSRSRAHADSSAGLLATDPRSYTGHDLNGIPHYATRAFTPEERALLRTVYGVEDPSRLYISDSTPAGVLKYDTGRKGCAKCYVNSYRIGYASIRRPGESWEELERRVAATPTSGFPVSQRRTSTSISSLDPAIQAEVTQMLADARQAGFRPRVVATYRSPVAQAFFMRKHSRTHTLTSMHSYGRAIDIVIGDGNEWHKGTRRRWIEFRRWVTAYPGGDFRVLGSPDSTWDWPHIEMPSPKIGFHDIESAVARARTCTSPGASVACDFVP